jgi:hypothetical protein
MRAEIAFVFLSLFCYYRQETARERRPDKLVARRMGGGKRNPSVPFRIMGYAALYPCYEPLLLSTMSRSELVVWQGLKAYKCGHLVRSLSIDLFVGQTEPFQVEEEQGIAVGREESGQVVPGGMRGGKTVQEDQRNRPMAGSLVMDGDTILVEKKPAFKHTL